MVYKKIEIKSEYQRTAEQWFDNHFDCYTPVDKNQIDPDMEPAMTKETFLKFASQSLPEISDEEIELAGGVYEKEYEESCQAPAIPEGAIYANEYFEVGAKWYRDEMKRRMK